MLEYLSGGEMLRQLQRLKRYSEANACQMFKQVSWNFKCVAGIICISALQQHPVLQPSLHT